MRRVMMNNNLVEEYEMVLAEEKHSSMQRLWEQIKTHLITEDILFVCPINSYQEDNAVLIFTSTHLHIFKAKVTRTHLNEKQMALPIAGKIIARHLLTTKFNYKSEDEWDITFKAPDRLIKITSHHLASFYSMATSTKVFQTLLKI